MFADRSDSQGLLTAEQAYLFRHAVLRDAAYELQLPAARAKLHALAIGVFEAVLGGRPAETPVLPGASQPPPPHPLDSFAAELAEHAKFAGNGDAIERVYLHRAAAVAERNFDNAGGARFWERLAELSDHSARVECLRRAGMSAFVGGMFAEAERLLLQAREVSRGGPDRLAEAVASDSLGNLLKSTGRAAQAEESHRYSLELLEQLGDRRRQGVVLGNLAAACYFSGKEDIAEDLYGRALELHREFGNRASEGTVLTNLTVVYTNSERHEEAERSIREALRIQREVGDRRKEGVALGNLGSVLSMTERTEAAEVAYTAALAIHREVGNRQFEGVALGNLANLYVATGRFQLAAETFHHAMAIHNEVGNRRFEAVSLCDYSQLLLCTGRVAEAEQAWQEGAAKLLQVRDRLALRTKIKLMEQDCRKAGIEPFRLSEETAAFIAE